MLFLPLALLVLLLPAGDAQDALREPMSFHLIQISSFFNSTRAQIGGSGWLGDLEILSWDTDTATPLFLKPWSKGNFSEEEISEIVELIRVYLFGFVREVQERAGDFQMEYPFEIQAIAGCELDPGGTIIPFLRGALGGLNFLSISNDTCWPAPEGGTRAQRFCKTILEYKGICDIIRNLLVETCPRYLMSVLAAGKADLQKQEKPEAWLSSGPSPGPGRLQLVCHVSGFHPKPVWVMWMRGEQEQNETQTGDILPNADETWYLRVSLEVAAGEAAGLSCRVKHSSLGGRDIVLHWGQSFPVGWVVLAVLVPCFIILLFCALQFYRRWSYQDIL